MATMTTAEEIPFTLTPTKPDGTPGSIDGVPTYVSSDEAVLTVVLDDPAVGLSGKLVSVGLGAAHATVSADVDLGAGVSSISQDSEEVAVTQDPAGVTSGFAFAFGAPQPKTP